MLKLTDIFNEGPNECIHCARPKAPLLKEGTEYHLLSDNMIYHIDNKLPITENTFRYGSEAFLDLWQEARFLYNTSKIILEGIDKELIEETDLGTFSFFEGQMVPIDLLLEAKDLEEDKKQPALNKPKRGGSKKFYVYVKDPKTKRIKKVSFGMAGGALRAKLNNPKARQAFAKRQRCSEKNDKTKAGYWACRLPRYSKLLGLKSSFSGFW